MHKKILALITSTLLASTLFVGCGDDENIGINGTINVYNSADYIDESLIKDFERETGIKVVYNKYTTNEEMYQSIKSKPGQYDLVFPSDYMIEKMINEDLAEEINFDNIPNYQYIDEKFKGMPYDTEDKYSVPYMWGTIGIIYDKDRVTSPITSWDALWDPQYKNEILMFDSIRDTFAIALKRLGYSINTTNPSEIEAAKKELIKQKSDVNPLYVVDDVKDKMIGGEAILATVWSGDAMYIMGESELNLEYVVPKEGSNKWFDGMVIPKGAPNKAGAESFINFLCDPNNAYINVDYIEFSTPNKGAFDLLGDEVKENEGAYPPDSVLDKCEVFIDLKDNIKLYDDAWLEVKS